MKIRKLTGNQARRFLDKYRYSSNYSLTDCYKNPSEYKLKAENFCRQIMDEEDGRSFKIIGCSTFCFTCAWLVSKGGWGTGELYLRVETRENSYIMPYTL